MKKLFVLAIVLAGLTIFSGCQKDEQLQVAIKDTMFASLDTIAFSVEDNRLVLKAKRKFRIYTI